MKTEYPIRSPANPTSPTDGARRHARNLVPLLMLTMLTLSAAVQAQFSSYTALYVFGDSWSATSGGLDGLYWRSRWSNGPMWPETLSTNWGLTYLAAHNYAKGGATTSDVIGSQVPRFNGASNAASSLSVVWAGQNDFYFYLVPNGTLNTQAMLKDKSFTGPGKDYVFWDGIL